MKSYADELSLLLQSYAEEANNGVLLSKLNVLTKLTNANDVRTLAFAIVKDVMDKSKF